MPTCRNPAHRNGAVVRAGWHGVAPHRRQRWLCKLANGDTPHRFSEELPRQEREGSHCSECSSALDPWEGQAGARDYAFHARDIAHALMLVASGVSYRQAAKATRTAAARGSSGVTWGQRVPRMRQHVVDGQLVANWVDVFGPVVTFAHGHGQWPERMAVDSVGFRSGGAVARGFNIMVAVGYEAPSFREPKVWLMRPFVQRNQDAWEEFFNLLGGTPRRIVADIDASIAGAVDACFPRANSRPPTYHWSDLHVRRALENTLWPLQGQPTHDVFKRLERSLFSTSEWDRFVHAVTHEDQTATPMPAATRWLGLFGARIREQAHKPRPRPVLHRRRRDRQPQARHRAHRRARQPPGQPQTPVQAAGPDDRRTQRSRQRAGLREGHPPASRRSPGTPAAEAASPRRHEGQPDALPVERPAAVNNQAGFRSRVLASWVSRNGKGVESRRTARTRARATVRVPST